MAAGRTVDLRVLDRRHLSNVQEYSFAIGGEIRQLSPIGVYADRRLDFSWRHAWARQIAHDLLQDSAATRA